jgi:calcineurin-like phosphoesterase
MKILIIGDVYGKSGLKAIDQFLPELNFRSQRNCNHHIRS